MQNGVLEAKYFLLFSQENLVFDVKYLGFFLIKAIFSNMCYFSQENLVLNLKSGF